MGRSTISANYLYGKKDWERKTRSTDGEKALAKEVLKLMLADPDCPFKELTEVA